MVYILLLRIRTMISEEVEQMKDQITETSINPQDSEQSGKDGFTLVETIIAMVILAVGLGACALTFNMALLSVSNNQNRMAALHFARDELEQLRTLPFTHAALAPGVTYTISDNSYTGSYTVTTVNADLINISLSISWDNAMGGGMASTEVLTTSLARPLH